METLTLPLQTLIDPVGAVPRAVNGRRWVVPLLLAAVLSSLSGAVIATRLDVAPGVIAKLQQEGDLSKKSEREIGEAIEQSQRVALVGGIARGLLLVPLLTLFGAIALRLIAWLLGLKTTFSACFSVFAIAQLPKALFHGIQALVAFNQVVISEKRAPDLVKSALSQFVTDASPKLLSVLSAVDFFNLWCALALGLGLSAAASLSKPRGIALGLVLYVLFACVFFIGLPGMAGRPGGHP